MKTSKQFVISSAFVFVAWSAAWAQVTTLVSLSSSGAQSNANSFTASITADGRYVAFASNASNLVAGDTNGFEDVFVRDRQLGTTEIVSVSTSGIQGNSVSFTPAISADGRYVAFTSLATTLDPADTNIFDDVYVHDRLTGTTELVSVSSAGVLSNADCLHPAISADGRYVAFASTANTLVLTGTSGTVLNVFLRDRTLGTTELVSHRPSGGQGNGDSDNPSLSSDGHFVAYESHATNLVAGDPNFYSHIFVLDRVLDVTECDSVTPGGVPGNNGSETPAISADGRFVAFASSASDLVVGDTTTFEDVFVRDRQLGTTVIASVSSRGAQGNSVSTTPAISADGRYVAFHSAASNLVPNDTNQHEDIFVHDLQTGATVLASVSSSGVQADLYSFTPSISGDGRFVAFESFGDNLVPGDTNTYGDIFVRDQAIPISAFCAGDGSLAACPCGNDGVPTHGCENSAGTGGALLTATGSASLSSDTLVLSSAGELPSALSSMLQGTLSSGPVNFGDGLRCVSGSLKRLYSKNAVSGTATAPSGADPSVSSRSAAVGDVIPAGASRFYQVYYRDPNLAFCPNPPGNSWNVSSGLAIVWDN
jgi:Tol biopolymer transport system component